MISKLYNYWQILKGNLWFVPAVFCVIFLGVTAAFYSIEVHYFQNYDYPKFFFHGTTDDAKSVTITLLSAMITMATLAISITMVVLSLAASQLGPRLIKTFMADRRTKDFIGLFFGTVMACFVLTVILHSHATQTATPQMTISAVFSLCLINLFVLLGFVHHVAQASIADNIILKVSTDLKSALNRLTTDIVKHRYDKPEESSAWPDDFDTKSHHIIFAQSGYVQNINYDRIMEVACKENLLIQITFKAGHFLVKGEDGVRIYAQANGNTEGSSNDNIDDAQNKIRAAFIIGDQRTATQDIEYPIRHLVEIAIRALSPGINDSFTAMNVLDHLSAALAVLCEKETPEEAFYDDNGTRRMQAKQSDDSDIVHSALDQIRFNGRAMPSVTRHFLKKLQILATLAKDDTMKSALKRQLTAILHDLKQTDTYIPEREDLQKQTKELIEELSKTN
tara:strand:+ start:47925 stop:49274 length:1350 start_codon:yes stop_codon:yes gene_type:complete